MPAMSASTGAPAALARSEGWKVLTSGMATPAAPAHPTTQVETSAARREGSMLVLGSVSAIRGNLV
jgi:hypothetical protein